VKACSASGTIGNLTLVTRVSLFGKVQDPLGIVGKPATNMLELL